MKEREGGDVAVDRQDFSKEVCGVDKARKEDKTDFFLTGPLLDPV